MIQNADYGLAAASTDNRSDRLQDADETFFDFTNSSVDEMECGQESSVSSILSPFSKYQPEAMAESRTTALHEAEFGFNPIPQVRSIPSKHTLFVCVTSRPNICPGETNRVPLLFPPGFDDDRQ